MHRKFIALIVTAAVIVTGATAPARADDNATLGKVLAGLAVLGVIGLAVKAHNDDDDDVAHYTAPTPTTPAPVHDPYHGAKPHGHNGHGHRPHAHRHAHKHAFKHEHGTAHTPKPKPLPHDVSTHVLPRRCSVHVHGATVDSDLLGASCLQKHYPYHTSLPGACLVRHYSYKHGEYRTSYSQPCLERRGYRVAGR